MTAARMGHWLGCACTEFTERDGRRFCTLCGLRESRIDQAERGRIAQTTRPTCRANDGEPLTGNPLEDSPI